jgi:hypothetical protein
MGMPVRRESLITLPSVWFSEMTCKDGEKEGDQFTQDGALAGARDPVKD